MISLDATDDDEVEIIKSKKKLSNLFDEDEDNISIEDSKSKLFYKPKQNNNNKKKMDENDKKSFSTTTAQYSKLDVFLALAVDVYKYDNNKYSYMGKYGMALLGNDQEVIYRILLYTAKNQHVCSATITESFHLICQPKNYCLFLDDQRQNWSILFSNHFDVYTFCRHIAHCLYAIKDSAGSSDVLVIQPLGYHKPPNEDMFKNIESENFICFKLQIRAFETNRSLYSSDDSSTVLFDGIEHQCLIMDTNLEILKQLFENLNPGDRNYMIIPFRKLNQYQSVIPIEKLGEIKPQKHDKIWKLALEFQLLGFETNKVASKHKKVELSSSQAAIITPEGDNIDKELSIDSKMDLSTKMTRMGALPIFPLINNNTEYHRIIHKSQKSESAFKEISELESKTNLESSKNSHVLESSTDVISSSFFQKFLETKFDTIIKSIEDIKFQIKEQQISQNESKLKQVGILDSNLTLDSAILLNSIQKLIDENHKLKSDIDEKKLEVIQIQQKLFQLIESKSGSIVDSGCSTPNAELVLKLKEEIVDLKDRINGLKEENYRLQKNYYSVQEEGDYENIPLPRPRNRNQLKQILNEIHQRFGQAIQKISAISEKDKQQVNDVLDLILKEIAQNVISGGKYDTIVSDQPFHDKDDKIAPL